MKNILRSVTYTDHRGKKLSVKDDAIHIGVTINGEEIETTPWHLFYTSEGWVEAGDLQDGDSIVSLGGVYGTVERVIIVDAVQTMHDLTVEEVHIFAVGDGDWVVHNCDLTRIDYAQMNTPLKKAQIRRSQRMAENIINDAVSGRISTDANSHHSRHNLTDAQVATMLANADAVYVQDTGVLLFHSPSGDIVIAKGIQNPNQGRVIITAYGATGTLGSSGTDAHGGNSNDQGLPITIQMIESGQVPNSSGGLQSIPTKVLK